MYDTNKLNIYGQQNYKIAGLEDCTNSINVSNATLLSQKTLCCVLGGEKLHKQLWGLTAPVWNILLDTYQACSRLLL